MSLMKSGVDEKSKAIKLGWYNITSANTFIKVLSVSEGKVYFSFEKESVTAGIFPGPEWNESDVYEDVDEFYDHLYRKHGIRYKYVGKTLPDNARLAMFGGNWIIEGYSKA